MVYRIEISKKVKKELDKIPEHDRIKIVLRLKELAYVADDYQNSPLDIKPMQGVVDTFRLRVGDYRIVYEKFKMTLIIELLKVAHRKDVYKSEL